MGAVNMEEKKLSSDAYQWMYNRYIKDDTDARSFLKEVKIQADVAGQIYSIRNKLHMTREDLAEFSGLTPETIEDLEESDYDGDWEEAAGRINRAFHQWFTNVILPAAQMTPDDYSVKAVNA
jgi:DNA-binding protein HU-beta